MVAQIIYNMHTRRKLDLEFFNPFGKKMKEVQICLLLQKFLPLEQFGQTKHKTERGSTPVLSVPKPN